MDGRFGSRCAGAVAAMEMVEGNYVVVVNKDDCRGDGAAGMVSTLNKAPVVMDCDPMQVDKAEVIVKCIE